MALVKNIGLVLALIAFAGVVFADDIADAEEAYARQDYKLALAKFTSAAEDSVGMPQNVIFCRIIRISPPSLKL